MEAKLIMIVDDDADDREIFCEALHEVDTSVQCISCSSAMEALELLRSAQQPAPDYIFLDLNMPRMNGKQCLQELKAMDKLKNMEVIIYSTSKMPDDVKETKKQGAVHFVTKPYRFSDVRSVIRSVLLQDWGHIESTEST
jgi:CheY-like chemotaxis protein